MMDCVKIYESLCDYCKTVKPEERLKRRNPDDKRIGKYIYTESHHIVPRHSGGSNDEDNLVNLLPEEHYLAHLIRYKAYGNRKDFVAVRRIVNGFENPAPLKLGLKESLENIPRNKKYGLYRAMINGFRKEHGWHTDDGIKRISESKKGKMLCKDSITGDIVGYRNIDDDDVISGKVVHHTKGTLSAYRKDTEEKVRVTVEEFRSDPNLVFRLEGSHGKNNRNYKEMTEIYDCLKKSTIENNYVCKKVFDKNIKEEFTEYKRIGLKWIDNRFGNLNNFLDHCNEKFSDNIKYDPYYRSSDRLKKSSELAKTSAWVTNGKDTRRIRSSDLNEYMKKGYYRGRTL